MGKREKSGRSFGVNRNERCVYLIVVDGRETSAGVTFDGGGSSTMVIEGVDARPRIVNTVMDANIPGRKRAVANHLGIALRK